MKYLILIFLSISISWTCFAQNDSASQKFIRSVIKEKGIIYTDSLGDFAINEMNTAFDARNRHRNGNSFFIRNNISNSRIVFTRKECAYIKKELIKLKLHAWQSGLISNATIISMDTIKKIFDNGPFGWDYFYSHYGRSFYSFSKPIFLRNHTICMFYSGSSCGELCGGGDFSIYIKSKKGWKKICVLSSWIS